MIFIGSTILVLGILIFVHELGHFLVAKSVGIRVEKFSLGFPPKMLSKKIGDTEYTLSWIPLGGYVKMAGENPEDESTSGKPWEFMSKAVWQRAKVIMAGPLMNFFLAIFLFWMVLFFQGQREIYTEKTEVGLVEEGGPAEKAGIMPGDEIISVNGKVVTDFQEMAEIIYTHVEEPVVVEWIRDGEKFKKEIVTQKEKTINLKGETEYIGRIGIGPTYSEIKLGFFEAFWEGLLFAFYILWITIKFVGSLILGQVSLKLVGGPIFIAQTAGETAKMGFSNLLTFMGVLSVNLALVNILPIPILDGGHLVFLLIEKIKGSPLSIKQRAFMQQIGMVFLLALILLVTYNDLVRWLK